MLPKDDPGKSDKEINGRSVQGRKRKSKAKATHAPSLAVVSPVTAGNTSLKDVFIYAMLFKGLLSVSGTKHELESR